MKRLNWIPCVALTLAMSGAALADELENVEKQVISKFRDNRSISAKVTKKAENKSDKAEIKINGQGTYEFLEKGEKSVFRLEYDETMDMSGGLKMTNKVKSLEIGDGEAYYSFKDQSISGKRATKGKLDGLKGWNVPALLATLRKDFNLKLLPEAKVGDAEVYVIEATSKAVRAGGQAKKFVYSFAKNSGVVMKEAEVNDKGEELQSYTLSEIKLNEKIDPDRFKFKAPEGVEVVDQTGGAKAAKP